MKNYRMVMVLLGLLLITSLVSACVAAPAAAPAAEEAAATEAAPAEEAAAAKPYIPVISKGFQHQFWQAVKLGSDQAAADYNVDITFEGPATESEVDKQIEMLEAALAKNPAAICFAALDTQAAIPLLEEANSRGIPVVGFDSGVDSDIPVATAATDNLAAAALAADKMAELIGGAGQIAVLVHDQTSRTGIDLPRHRDRQRRLWCGRPPEVHRSGQGGHSGQPGSEGLLWGQRRVGDRRVERRDGARESGRDRRYRL